MCFAGLSQIISTMFNFFLENKFCKNAKATDTAFK